MKRIVAWIVISLALAGSSFAQSRPPAAQKEWTVATFLNADNDLDKFGVRDQAEMSWIGSNEWLNIVTLFDRARQPAVINYIGKDRIEPVTEPEEIDMGDPKELVRFARFLKDRYPAKHYCICIWNHGTGWRSRSDRKNPPVVKGISYDFTSGNNISTNQLGAAMKEIRGILGKNLDILAFDACLMQTVEVAYACHESVDFIVGSEETEPGTGAPYDDILKTLTPTTSPEEFSRQWVKTFVRTYIEEPEAGNDTAQSAIRCSEIPHLVQAMEALSGALSSSDARNQADAARRGVQTFAYADQIDLAHFCTRLVGSMEKQDSSPVVQACRKVLEVISRLVVESGTAGPTVANARGIAVYFPGDYALAPEYRDLGFAMDTGWDEMITSLKTARVAGRIHSRLLSGDLSTLLEFVSSSRNEDPGLRRAVIRDLNFRVAHEGPVPAGVLPRIQSLLDPAE